MYGGFPHCISSPRLGINPKDTEAAANRAKADYKVQVWFGLAVLSATLEQRTD